MSDTSTLWSFLQGLGDWALTGNRLQTGNDLETAVLISLFTDREAGPDDVIVDGTDDPRGWWGDSGEDVKIGSRLWLLARSKQENEVLAKAKEYIDEALQWLIDDGVVVRFEVTTEWASRGMLGAKIVAYQKDGSMLAMNYSWVWKGVN